MNDERGGGLDGVFGDDDETPPAEAPTLPAGLPPALAALIEQKGAIVVPPADADDAEGDGHADGDGDDESLPDVELDRLALMGFTQTPAKKRWSRLPGMIAQARRLVWRAARWRGVLVAVLQSLSGLAIGAQLLAANNLLTQALALRQANGDLRDLVPQALVVAGVATFVAVLNGISTSQQSVVSELVGNQAHREITEAAAAADLASFEDPDFYNRLQRAATGGQFRPFQLVFAVLGLSSGVLGMLGIGLALFAIEPVLIPLTLLAAIPVWIATVRNARAGYVMMMNNTPDERERTYLRSVLTERDPAKEVRAFNLAGYLRRRHDVVSDRILARIAKEAWTKLARNLAGQAGGGVAAAIGGGALLWLLVAGRIPVAGAVTAALAMQQLRGKVTGLAHSAGGVYESALYLEDYVAFVDEAKRRPEPPTGAVAPFTRLAAEGVSFSYPGGKPALRSVDVEIGPGEVVALVGENGSGKTTLAKLLCGLYEPTAGSITWDGVDLRELDPAAVREHITVIFQDFVHYALPARDNVGLGRHQRLDDEEALVAAVRLAGLDKIFDKLPEGWETVLGRQFTGGQDLSGGQWQRVALARAFFRDAPFLVLDEPTAALDARAEHRLFQRLRDLAHGRSVLLITHRFANVRMADRIYVLDKGRVTEHGSHAELMRHDGQYAELFNLQASSFVDAPPPAAPPVAR